MKTQLGVKKGTILKKFALGAHPIIEDYVRRLRIAEIIASHIKQDHRLQMACEKVITVMIHNILTAPKAMYELLDWALPLSEEVIGLEPGESEKLTDDRVGKTLDLFYYGKHKEVFFRLALRAIKIFDLNCSRIHQDTTTATFSGSYRTWSASELLTHGHNKDHRPDLKQLVLGISVTSDGAVPLDHKVYDGNQTDDKLHTDTHRRLRKLLSRSDFIYVADCKLATSDNLSKIVDFGGRFITVMPRTWKEDKQFRKQVRLGQVTWKHLLSRKNNRKPESKRDHYYLAQGSYGTSAGYALLWIKSTQKAEQDSEIRNRHLDKALEELRFVQGRLNTYKLKTRTAIKAQVSRIAKTYQCQNFLTCKILRHREYRLRYKKSGRPGPNNPATKIYSFYFSLSFEVNQNEVNAAKLTDGIFPLITNVHKELSAKQILESYKFQPFLEKRHSQIKTYQQVAPAYVKKGERVVALLHIHVMALTVATLIERQLRIGMKNAGIEAIPIYPTAIPCKYPTMFDIARLFDGVDRYEVQNNDNNLSFPARLSKTQQQVLNLLNVPQAVYH